MKYSIIVPVFNRPDEIDELLESLTRQTFNDFEVIIVEDGSQKPCKEVCDKYTDKLNLKYFMKENSGPGQSRNYGAERSEGEYLLILDSDVVLPENYLYAIEEELHRDKADAFGGPDRAHNSFTDTQKAISYSMTSFFTTGGIRGGKKKMDKFYPRSFNMGIRREVYNKLGGFSKMRFGEDIDFSIRIFKAGCKCRLFPGAWVYHKRRTDFSGSHAVHIISEDVGNLDLEILILTLSLGGLLQRTTRVALRKLSLECFKTLNHLSKIITILNILIQKVNCIGKSFCVSHFLVCHSKHLFLLLFSLFVIFIILYLIFIVKCFFYFFLSYFFVDIYVLARPQENGVPLKPIVLFYSFPYT